MALVPYEQKHNFGQDVVAVGRDVWNAAEDGAVAVEYGGLNPMADARAIGDLWQGAKDIFNLARDGYREGRRVANWAQDKYKTYNEKYKPNLQKYIEKGQKMRISRRQQHILKRRYGRVRKYKPSSDTGRFRTFYKRRRRRRRYRRRY